MPKVVKEIEGHSDMRTVDVGADGWQAVCECGYEFEVRETAEQASADRFEHEEQIGAVEYVEDES